MKTNLSGFNNDWYEPGSKSKRIFWYLINELVIKNTLIPSSGLRKYLLRIFGAKIGNGVIIKPGVNVKYPWKLTIGNHCWIGENVWIDNLDNVTIENNVCVSQGALLLCGNHNYKLPSFNLIVKPIILKEGCWVGAKSIVAPGVCVGAQAVLSLASVASDDLEPNFIYRGNPAKKIKVRYVSTV